MSIRTLLWQVGDDMEVTPVGIQKAGVQGDHHATQAVFVVPEKLQEGYDLYIELVTNAGGYDKTDALPLVDGTVSYLLPLAWTQDGGKAVLRLVAVEREPADGAEPETVHSADGRISFMDRSTGFAKVQALVAESIHRMMDLCKKSTVAIEKAVKRVEEIATNFANNVKDTIAGRCYKIIEQNKQVAMGLWIGSSEEYTAQDVNPNNTICIFTDDPEGEQVLDDISTLKTAVEALQRKTDYLNDYVTEFGQVTVGNITWTYEKRASGIAECWGIISQTVTTAPSWNMFGATGEAISFPPNLFVDAPVVNPGTTGERWCHPTLHNVTAGYVSLYYLTATADTVSPKVHIRAKGFWKALEAVATVSEDEEV